MKKLTPALQHRPPLYSFRYLTLLFLLLTSTMLLGQRKALHLSETIDVPQDVLIRTVGPQSVRINGRGMINARHLEGKYVVSGKDAIPHVYVIHKTLEINSWEKGQVKQEVEVILETETSEQTAQLTEALRPILQLTAGNILTLNCELNIAQFSVNNGWFREDANSITLTDGRVFAIKYLEIINRFFVPASVTLDFDLNRTNLSLGDHTGSIELKQAFGQVASGCLREITAQLTDAHILIDNLDEANLQLTNCELRMGKVGKLTMSTSLSAGEIDSVGQLRIDKSVSDRLKFRQVRAGNASKTFFSKINIGQLLHSWQLDGKGTTLFVKKIGDVFRSFQVNNKDGDIRFPLYLLPSYKLWCGTPTQNDYQLPGNLQKHANDEVNTYYEQGTTENASIIRLAGQRCKFQLRP